ncbi:MAG: DUF748 domain-containing protein, partial [Planctomycetes bacterium]|nr:DUF748 domain-containing protein [Planctomycetota bacterium]
MTTKPTGARRWRRWLVRLAFAAVAARLLLALCLPWLVDLAARAGGLTVAVRSSSLSLLGLSLQFQGVVARDPEDPGAPVLFAADQVAIDLSTLQALRGTPTVVDAVVAGGRIEVERRADGTMRLPRSWSAPATSPAPEPPASKDTPVSFDFPIHVAAARIHDLRIAVTDRSTATPRRDECSIDVDARDLGRADRGGSIDLRVHSPSAIDDLWLRVDASMAAERMTLSCNGAMRGLRTDSALLPPGFREAWPDVRSLGFDLHGDLRGARIATAPTRAVWAGSLGIAALADGREFATLDAELGESEFEDGGARSPFSLVVKGQDVVDELALRNGRIVATAAGVEITATVDCRGASLRRFQPWLAKRGIELPKEGVAAHATLNVASMLATGTPSTTLRVEGAEVVHGDERVVLRRLVVDDVRSTTDGVAIGAVTIDGPEIAVSIDGAGGTRIAGTWLRATAPGAAATAPPANGSVAWPHVALGRLDWRGGAVVCTDLSFAEPAALRIDEIAVSGTNLRLGSASAPGRLVATCLVPDAVGGARLEIDTTPGPASLAADFHFAANDITLGALRPWLTRAGLLPALHNARATASGSLRVATEDGVAIDATIANLRLEEDGQTLLGFRTMTVAGMRLRPTTLALGSWTLLDPGVAIRREGDGSMSLCGLRTIAGPDPAAAAPPTRAAGPTPPPAPERAPTITHGQFLVRDARVQWADAGALAATPVSIVATAQVDADDGTAAAVRHRLDLRIDNAIETLRLAGSTQRSERLFRFETELTGAGIHGNGLAALMPPSLRCTMHAGRLHAKIAADWTHTPTNGLLLRIDEFVLQDREQELFAVDSFVLDAPELRATEVHVQSLRCQGVRATAASTSDGLHVPGMLLTPAASPTTSAPTEASSTPAAPAKASTPVAAAAAPRLLPAIRVDEAVLDLQRLVWRDRIGSDGRPLEASAHVELAEPWKTARDPADSRPARLRATAAVAPVCRELAVDIDLSLFTTMPTVDADVRASGIDTTTLPDVLPSLANRIGGTARNATISGKAHATVDLHRRNVTQFDFAHPFGGEVVIEDLAVRDESDDPLLTADLVGVHARSLDPATGEVHLRAIEVEGVRARLAHTPEGLEVLGVRIGPAPAATVANQSANQSATPARTSSATGPAFALDRLHFQDIAVDFVDRTTTPATRLPIREIDLLVQGVSTQSISEGRPVSFSLTGTGGEVSLERRVLRSSAIAGLLGSAAHALVGEKDQHTTEERLLFDDLTVSGQTTIGPRPTGEVTARVRSLELPALRGMAKGGGVDLADGVYDLDARIEMLGDRGTRLTTRSKFTWLSLAEPPGGPISTYLRLPVPLDTALFLLRNDADEHVIPVAVDVPPGGPRTSAVAGALGEALVKVLADAISSAGLRSAGVLTGAVGLGADASPMPSGVLEFAAGASVPSSGAFDAVIEAMADDPDLGVVLV